MSSITDYKLRSELNASAKAWGKELFSNLTEQQSEFFDELKNITLSLSRVTDDVMSNCGRVERNWEIEVSTAATQSEEFPYREAGEAEDCALQAPYLLKMSSKNAAGFRGPGAAYQLATLNAEVVLSKSFQSIGAVTWHLVLSMPDTMKSIRVDLPKMLAEIGVVNLDLEDLIVNHARFFASQYIARKNSTLGKAFASQGVDARGFDRNYQFNKLMQIAPAMFTPHQNAE